MRSPFKSNSQITQSTIKVIKLYFTFSPHLQLLSILEVVAFWTYLSMPTSKI
jgi:hypothetical protein